MPTIETIIHAYGPALARVATSYEADRALREDLLQEMLFAIHRALPSLREDASLAPFVFRIAHNRGVTHALRQRAARLGALQMEPPAEPTTPEESRIESERTHRLQAAIRRLPVPYRQVITLVLEEMSYQDIATTLGIGISNVGVRVSRAKAQLKEFLRDE
jgi:RNA polymerase sigma-70 factor (ECF subfamily)